MDDLIVDALTPNDPLRVFVPEFRGAWKRQQPIHVGAILGQPLGHRRAGDTDAVLDRLGEVAALAPVLDSAGTSNSSADDSAPTGEPVGAE